MFPLPQCPICRLSFPTLAEAIAHLDAQHPSAFGNLRLEPETDDFPTLPEADDPTPRHVEEAG